MSMPMNHMLVNNICRIIYSDIVELKTDNFLITSININNYKKEDFVMPSPIEFAEQFNICKRQFLK